METSVKKWGNSLGVRIPQTLAASIGVRENSAVDITTDGNVLIIKPIRQKLTLAELVSRITPSNRHEEFDWEPPQGREVW